MFETTRGACRKKMSKKQCDLEDIVEDLEMDIKAEAMEETMGEKHEALSYTISGVVTCAMKRHLTSLEVSYSFLIQMCLIRAT